MTVADVATTWKQNIDKQLGNQPKRYSIMVKNALPFYQFNYKKLGEFEKADDSLRSAALRSYFIMNTPNAAYYANPKKENTAKPLWDVFRASGEYVIVANFDKGTNHWPTLNQDKWHWLDVEHARRFLIIFGIPHDKKEIKTEILDKAIDRFRTAFKMDLSVSPIKRPELQLELAELQSVLKQYFSKYIGAVIYNRDDPHYKTPLWQSLPKKETDPISELSKEQASASKVGEASTEQMATTFPSSNSEHVENATGSKNKDASPSVPPDKSTGELLPKA